MNRNSLFVLGAAILLAACNGPQGGASGSADQGNLAGANIGGPFTLTDQDGARKSWSDFNGKYRLVYFGYSYCPDVCPVDLQLIAQGFRLFEKRAPERAAKLQPIFITLDPERDTPQVLKNYVSAFDPHLIGLTGTPEEIAAVAKKFVVVYNKETPKGSTDYLVSHSRTPFLFGPQGEPITLMPVDDPATGAQEGTPEEIAQTLDRWVK